MKQHTKNTHNTELSHCNLCLLKLSNMILGGVGFLCVAPMFLFACEES